MRALYVLFSVSLVGLAGCGSWAGSSDHKFSGTYPIKAVCTTGMVADLVRHVGGKHVTIDQLMGDGVDPHNFAPTTGHVTRLNRGDIIFYSGLHLEGKMDDIFKKLASKRATCGVAESIDASTILHDDENKHDPHLWFDVALWSQGVNVVRDKLAAFDPKNAEDYKANAAKYQKELGALHEDVKKEIASISKEQRVLITSHDAFRYFKRAYDIEVRGIQGISTESEASLKHINELVEFITTRKVKAVFVETSVNKRNMEALMEGCKARGHEVVMGGELFSDAMGKEGTTEGTYIGMIRHNVRTIVQALR